MEKVEIACYEQFLLFSQCLKRLVLQTRKNQGFFLVKSLTDDKILALSKLKEFADNNLSVAQLVQFYYERVENMVGKGENVGYQRFLLFPTMLSKGSFLKVVKIRGV